MTSQTFPWEDTSIPFITDKKYLKKVDGNRRGAHALLFCKNKSNLLGNFSMSHAVMMQLRFDGMLGFPGGFVEEEVVDGLNRELSEEIGLKPKYFLKNSNYHGTWIHNMRNHRAHITLHFFVKQYSEKEFLQIEANALNARDWGGEALGIVRVPLHDSQSLANFFAHNFVGNAREQLIKVLIEFEIVTLDQVRHAWDLFSNMI